MARPDSVDTGPRVEDLHRCFRIDPDQEHRVAVVFPGAFAEPLRLVVDDGSELGVRQDQDCDELAVESEGAGEGFFDPRLDLGGRSIGAQHHIAAGDVRRHVREAELLQEATELRHRYFVLAAHVDAAEEDEIALHMVDRKTGCDATLDDDRGHATPGRLRWPISSSTSRSMHPSRRGSSTSIPTCSAGRSRTTAGAISRTGSSTRGRGPSTTPLVG